MDLRGGARRVVEDYWIKDERCCAEVASDREITERPNVEELQRIERVQGGVHPTK
jgi:hypothetical protein